MLIDEIKKANVQSIKSKDSTARAVYSVVINKYMLFEIKNREVNKEITDVDIVAILQKTIKELTEEAENYDKVGNSEQKNVILKQKSILEQYLPKMLTEKEITEIISNLEDKTIPFVMKYFKANYDGKVDMGLVNKVARSIQ
ncbi:MAG: GatB/YqeY domain-containing protein [Clostridia bacterium]|nr:GatB/YqeY domain-containing protein [Clostridia bacterium]